MIRPVGSSDPIVPPAEHQTLRRPGGNGGVFTVPEEIAVPKEAARAQEVAPLEAMLALQEVGEGPAGISRDREARERGRRMLALLRRLQAALLGPAGRPDPALLETLGASLADLPEAEDPALREAVGAVALRVRIELARWGRR